MITLIQITLNKINHAVICLKKKFTVIFSIKYYFFYYGQYLMSTHKEFYN